MKLKTLFENGGQAGHTVKQFALHLQQAILEQFDDLDIKLDIINAITSGWQVIMTLAFDHYSQYQPQIDISCLFESPAKCLVGVTGQQKGDINNHRFIYRNGDVHWESPNDELIKLLKERFLEDIAILVGSDVSKRATVSLWDDYEPADTFVPFDHPIPNYMLTSPTTGPMIAQAALDGLHVKCKAIRVIKKDPVGTANALNVFNDDVLRKQPKPRLLNTQIGDINIFVYATHEA